MRALVTGAAGFIGSHLCAQLLADGAKVIGLDAFTPYYSESRKWANVHAIWAGERGWAFTFVRSAISTRVVRALLEEHRITHVFHLAGQPGVRPSWGSEFTSYTALNVDATQQVLEGCLGVSLERVVYASTSAVYGVVERLPIREGDAQCPVSPYGVTKLAGEHLCQLYHRAHGVPVVILRYFTVYGPRQRPDMAFSRFCAAIRKGAPITVYGDGCQTRSFTYVNDVVDATRRAGVAGGVGAVYNVGGGSRISVLDALTALERIAGVPASIRFEPMPPGEMVDTEADITRAGAALGYAPQHPYEDGLARQWAATVDQHDPEALCQ